MDNCGYWLYSGSSDVPKVSGSIKHIATQSADPVSRDLGGRPVLDWDTNPLPDSGYTSSRSVPRIFTRAEKGQALSHLEMDFNLASLFHKANTSSTSYSFDPSELSTNAESSSKRPWAQYIVEGRFEDNVLLEGVTMIDDCEEAEQHLTNWYGLSGSLRKFGPYKYPDGLAVEDPTTVDNFYRETKNGESYNYKKQVPQGTDLETNRTGSYYYVYYKELAYDPVEGIYPGLNSGDRCYTAVTNSSGTEITFNPIAASETPESYGNGTGIVGDKKDIYFNLHKAKRDEEKAGLFATFSYAPIKNGNDTIIQNPYQTIKVQHTTDEIRYKLANEQIPGTLHIRQNFYVTGSTYMKEDLTVEGSEYVSESVLVKHSLYVGDDTFISGSTTIRKNLNVEGKGTIDQDLEVHGSESVDGNSLVKGDLFVDHNAIIKETISGGKELYIEGDFDLGHNTNGGVLIQGRKNPSTSTHGRPDDIIINGNVRINGSLYANSWIGGNLSNAAYNSLENPNYATEYSRFGTVDTGSQSDERLKKNLTPIFDPLYKLDQVRGYEFDWAKEAEKSGHDVGLIAQELQPVYPEAVAEGQDGYLRIDYSKLVPLLVEAIKELRCQVRELQNNK